MQILRPEERSQNVIQYLASKFFREEKSTKICEFNKANARLLADFHPEYHKLVNMSNLILKFNRYECLLASLRFKKLFERVQNETCEEFQLKTGKLEIPLNFMEIANYSTMQTEDFLTSQEKLFRKVLGHMLWLANVSEVFVTVEIDEDSDDNISFNPDDYFRIVHQAVEYFETDIGFWFELLKYHSTIDKARNVFNKALQKIPKSFELWARYADLELNEKNFDKARKILENSIKNIPKSAELWIKLGDLEHRFHKFDQEIRILDEAVNVNPESVELWLRFAKSKLTLDKTGQETEKVLIEALDVIPNSPELWIELIELQEIRENIQERIDCVLLHLADKNYEILPSRWIEALEHKTSDELIDSVIVSVEGIGDENEIKKCLKFPKYKTNSLFCKLRSDPTKKLIWVQTIFNEDCWLKESRMKLLEIAFITCPGDKNLRDLIVARLKWKDNKYTSAFILFSKVNKVDGWKGFIANAYSRFQKEMILKTSERQKKCMSFIEAPERFNKIDRTLLDYIRNYYLSNEANMAKNFLEKAVLAYPSYGILSILKGQMETKEENIDQAADTYKIAIDLSYDENWKICFIMLLAELHQKRKNLLEARNVLNQATLKYPSHVQPWIASIRLEFQANNRTEAKNLLFQAMKIFPESLQLLSHSIFLSADRRKTSVDATKKFENSNKDLLLAIAKMFMCITGQPKKSRKWFEKTIKLFPNFDDAWVYFYKFEKLFGTEQSAKKVLFQFVTREKKNNVRLSDDLYHNKIMNKFWLNTPALTARYEWKNFKYDIDNWDLTREELLIAMEKKIDIGRVF